MYAIGLLLAVLRIGIIGLDTSHSTAFTKKLNGPADPAFPEFAGCRVVAAVVKGSETVASSVEVQAEYTETVKQLGVEIVPDVKTLLEKVDAVCLESNDGQVHLKQAEEVFRSGKRMFIDKPLAHDLKDAVAIVDLAKKYGATFFTSSAIRYVRAIRGVKERKLTVRGMDCWTCMNYEPSHDKWYWYGVHAVDPLFAVLGRGCEEVVSLAGSDGDVAIGRWSDGRLGVARGLSTARPGAPYGGVIFTEEEGQVDMGHYEGYGAELKLIINYFRTGETPVSPEESLEVLAFMTAARMSSEQGGRAVRLADVLAVARR